MILISIFRLGTFLKYRNNRPKIIQTLFDTCLEKCRLLVGHLINSVPPNEHPAGALFVLRKQATGFVGHVPGEKSPCLSVFVDF